MITYICLAWLGVTLSAPTWYFTVLIIGFIIKMIKYGIEMYNEGRDDK